MSSEYETLRWPTNMDRATIVSKLVEIRDAANAGGQAEFAAFFDGIESQPSPKVGAAVIAALTWLEGKADYQAIGTRLSMVAMNLKNLR